MSWDPTSHGYLLKWSLTFPSNQSLTDLSSGFGPCCVGVDLNLSRCIAIQFSGQPPGDDPAPFHKWGMSARPALPQDGSHRTYVLLNHQH